jgi:D-glycero-alpha-D-manno-heptose 1-phosphate guanylyltransferase
MHSPLRALILAGGLGTRLRKVIGELPKPLAPIRGRPFLHYLIHHLELNGITEVVLSIGYQADRIKACCGTQLGTVQIRYVIEEEPLGTGGAILFASRSLPAAPIFILNGDTYVDVDFKKMAHAHAQAKADMTMAVCQLEDTHRYGRVVITNNRIAGFTEKGLPGPGYINAGVYYFNPALLSHRGLTGKFSFENDFLEKERSQLNIIPFACSGYFIDIGISEDYERAQRELTYGDQ